jgi:hypothetical protein
MLMKRAALVWLLAALVLAPLLGVSRLNLTDTHTQQQQEVGMRAPPAWPVLEPQAHLNLLNAPEHRAVGPNLFLSFSTGVLLLAALCCFSLDTLFTPARKHLIACRQLRLEGG